MQIHSDAQACPAQLFCDFLAVILLFLRRFDRTMFRASFMAALHRYTFGFFRKTRDDCPSKNLTKTFSIASSASCRFPVTHFAARYIGRKFSRYSASSSCLKISSFIVGTFVVAILSPVVHLPIERIPARPSAGAAIAPGIRSTAWEMEPRVSNKTSMSSFGDPGPGGTKAWTTLTNHFGALRSIASRGSFGVCSASVDCHRGLLDRLCR